MTSCSNGEAAVIARTLQNDSVWRRRFGLVFNLREPAMVLNCSVNLRPAPVSQHCCVAQRKAEPQRFYGSLLRTPWVICGVDHSLTTNSVCKIGRAHG